MRFRILALLICLFTSPAAPLRADPVAYVLDAEQSSVEFTYRLSGQEGSGSMPILHADLVLDFDRAARSSAYVELDATGARTGNPLITDALKGKTILNASEFPRIAFQSRIFTPQPGGATVTGTVTLRGVARPLVLNADIFRRAGSAPGDRSHLTVVLTGSLQRSHFGATGFRDLVGDQVDLRIRALINQID